jgi:hypothetical protein
MSRNSFKVRPVGFNRDFPETSERATKDIRVPSAASAIKERPGLCSLPKIAQRRSRTGTRPQSVLSSSVLPTPRTADV